MKEIKFKSKSFINLLGTEYEKAALVILAHKIDEIIDRINVLSKQK